MKVPISWLTEYVRVALPPEEVARRLTMAGVEVAAIERTRSWSGIFVGHVKQVRPHPNADRLRLVTVDTGSGESEVVCGAPNVAEGQKIAYGALGAEIFDGHSGKPSKLKASKIRGVDSTGMVLSRRELGLSDDHEGIHLLDPAAPLGAPLGDVLGETVLDLELSPNRADCLGVVGVARDVAALSGLTATLPPLGFSESGPDIGTLAKVTIESPSLCPRYTGAVIQGVKVGPSPDWLQDRLRAIGERPVNNIVDATNYAMFELGQPLHAFDYDLVAGRHITVRQARAGERLTTLDGVDRALTTEMLVIADEQRAIGLAGVMGGANSEISGRTVNVFLESANFDPVNNRRTARGLGLASQATVRFEKGLRAGLAEVGLRRCVGLILELAGGQAARGIIDVWPGKANEPAEVLLTRSRISSVLGADWPGALIMKTLRSLGFEPVPVSGGADASAWRVPVPYWRSDITVPEDLCEELARVIGYDKVQTTVLGGRVPRWEPQPALELREKVRDALVANGLQETIAYSATSEAGEARVRLPGDAPRPVRLQNPVSSDLGVLRRTLRESLLKSLAANVRTWRGPVALFEIGKVFGDVGEGLPDEREVVAGVLAGPRSDAHWAGDSGALDFYDAKGAVEAVLEALRIDATITAAGDPVYATGRAAAITAPKAGGLKLGTVGEVSREVAAAFDIEAAPVAMFELDLAALLSAVQSTGAASGAYAPYPRYPASPRDVALVLDDSVPAAEVVRLARRNRLVSDATVFDVFRGQGVPAGKKSLALRVVYQSAERTLTSEEVTKAEQAILFQLKKELAAELRA